jgi:ABC-type branched-subunit amino acid transport system substrate-binding protein
VALVALDDSSDPELARQAAASLAIDPAVVAVIAYWQPETDAAGDVYADAGLPLLELGRLPFEESNPGELSDDFLQAYEAVTPFDEVAGDYAAATYDAFRLIWLAVAEAQHRAGTIDRASVREALSSVEYSGLTGTVYQP